MLSGSNTPITTGAGESVMDATDGDFMELMAQVEGTMDVAGTMDIQPFVSMSKVFGYNFSTTIGINAYSKAYTVPTSKVAFQSTIVHIPLPNVHAPKEGVDLGDVKAGGSATKTVTIENTGEMAATMNFKSSDPQFTVPGGSITVAPKSKYDLQVKFASANAGAASVGHHGPLERPRLSRADVQDRRERRGRRRSRGRRLEGRPPGLGPDGGQRLRLQDGGHHDVHGRLGRHRTPRPRHRGRRSPPPQQHG